MDAEKRKIKLQELRELRKSAAQANKSAAQAKKSAAQAEESKIAIDELATELKETQEQLGKKTRQLEATKHDLQVQKTAAFEAATAAAQRDEEAALAIEKKMRALDELTEASRALNTEYNDSQSALAVSSQENAALTDHTSELEQQLQESKDLYTKMQEEHKKAAGDLRDNLEAENAANRECQEGRQRDKDRCEEEIATYEQLIAFATAPLSDVEDDEELQRPSTLKF